MYPQLGFDPAFHFTSDRKLAAISFGSDASTEHECGISPLRQAFGSIVPVRSFNGPLCTPYEHWKKLREERRRGLLGSLRSDPPLPPMGIERRKISKVPDGFGWVVSGAAEGFGFYGGWEQAGWEQTRVNQFATLPSQEVKELTAAWSDAAFLILGRGDAAIHRLKSFFHAIHDKDCVLTVGGGVFGGTGLTLSVASLLPEETKEKWLADDTASFYGDKRFEETGIVELLRSKGKDWFALGQYKIGHDGQWRAWLNPCDQQRYSAGAFTVEELRLWAEDKGPVVFQKKRKQ